MCINQDPESSGNHEHYGITFKSPPLLRFIAGGDARTHRVTDDKGGATPTALGPRPRRRLPAALRPLSGSEDREEVQAVRQGARVQAAPVRRARGPGEGRHLQGKKTILKQLCQWLLSDGDLDL